MPYIPNSAVTVLESLPGEFVYADTNKSFLGKYIKTKDNKLLVATYLGFEDVFGTDKTLKYKEHYNINVDKSIYDALEVQEFN